MVIQMLRIIKHFVKRLRFELIRKIRIALEQMAFKQWSKFPFGKSPLADKVVYESLFLETKQTRYPEIEKYEQAVGTIKQIKNDGYVVVRWDNINGDWHYTPSQAKKIEVINDESG